MDSGFVGRILFHLLFLLGLSILVGTGICVPWGVLVSLGASLLALC